MSLEDNIREINFSYELTKKMWWKNSPYSAVFCTSLKTENHTLQHIIYFSRTKKWYHCEADLIWTDGPFKFKQNKNCFFPQLPFFLWQEAGRFGKENGIKQFQAAFCSQKIYYLFHAQNKQSLNTQTSVLHPKIFFYWSSMYCSVLFSYIPLCILSRYKEQRSPYLRNKSTLYSAYMYVHLQSVLCNLYFMNFKYTFELWCTMCTGAVCNSSCLGEPVESPNF